MKKISTRQWILIGVLFALTVGVTALLKVRFDFTRQIADQSRNAGVYATLGDVCVYAAVMLLGGPWGALVSALGAAIADLILGSYSYIIASFLIKGGMAFFVAAFYKHCDTWKKCLVVAALTECIMILGYFAWEIIVSGFGQFALISQALVINLGQGMVCAALGMLLLRVLPPKAAKIAEPMVRPAQPGSRVK